jgi:hypothetical protein
MAEIDLRFLGERLERLQTDMRTIRTEQLRLEADQAAIRAEMAARFDAVDARVGSLARAVDAQFEQTHRMMATNLEIVLTALRGRES